jgi:hypothetical protein
METPMVRCDERRGKRVAAWAAMLLAAAPLPGWREIPIREIAPSLGARLGSEGLTVEVDGPVGMFLPLRGVEVLQLDYRSAGQVMLTWLSASGNTVPLPHSSPWHREVLAPGSGRVTLDLRTTPLWRPERTPFLLLEGTGTVVLTGLRVRQASQDPAERTRSFDEAIRWSPIRVAHSTINSLDTPFWSASRQIRWMDALGFAFAGLAIAGSVAWWAKTRRWRPGPPLALAAVVVALAGDVVFAVRAAPALSLVPVPETEARLRQWTAFHPELGPLAALARGAIGARERVGVQAAEHDWFGWETLCFQLAPRPCVRVIPGATAFSGLQGVDNLRADEIDAIVYFHAGAPLPAGFRPVASLDKNAFVARRR